MCLWRLSIKSEIVEKLNFLISSAYGRKTEQGVKTFAHYLKLINEPCVDVKTYKALYHELSGMQRFADFNNQEWQAVQAIFKTIEALN